MNPFLKDYLKSKRIDRHKNFSLCLSASTNSLFDRLEYVRCIVTCTAPFTDTSGYVLNEHILPFDLPREVDFLLYDKSVTVFTAFAFPKFHCSFSYSLYLGSVLVNSYDADLSPLSYAAYDTNWSSIQCRANYFVFAFSRPSSTNLAC